MIQKLLDYYKNYRLINEAFINLRNRRWIIEETNKDSDSISRNVILDKLNRLYIEDLKYDVLPNNARQAISNCIDGLREEYIGGFRIEGITNSVTFTVKYVKPLQFIHVSVKLKGNTDETEIN